jgi:hypothetical protein
MQRTSPLRDAANYAEVLKHLTDEAIPATGLSREQIEANLAALTVKLKGPMDNVSRLLLCEDRASLRKALAALPIEPS